MPYKITTLWGKPNPLDLKVDDRIVAGELIPVQTSGRTADGLGKAVSEDGTEHTLFYMDEENNEPIICPEKDCTSSPYADHWRYIEKYTPSKLILDHKTEIMVVGAFAVVALFVLSR